MESTVRLANLGFPGCYGWEKIYLVVLSDISCFQMDKLKKNSECKRNRNLSQACGQLKHEIARRAHVSQVGFRIEQAMKIK